MNRQQFLEQIGMGIAGTFLITCLGSCSKSNPSSPVQSVDFTLNLTDTAATPLLKAGGYIYTNGVIVAQTQSGTYIAVSEYCTHQGYPVNYSNNQFYCPAHGSVFSATGSVLQGPAGSPLIQYHVAVSGNSLHVYS
jgi:cytochrome b6-f complex iron-sulfur subunit